MRQIHFNRRASSPVRQERAYNFHFFLMYSLVLDNCVAICVLTVERTVNCVLVILVPSPEVGGNKKCLPPSSTQVWSKERIKG